jgi:hypothetical protein
MPGCWPNRIAKPNPGNGKSRNAADKRGLNHSSAGDVHAREIGPVGAVFETRTERENLPSHSWGGGRCRKFEEPSKF